MLPCALTLVVVAVSAMHRFWSMIACYYNPVLDEQGR